MRPRAFAPFGQSQEGVLGISEYPWYPITSPDTSSHVSKDAVIVSNSLQKCCDPSIGMKRHAFAVAGTRKSEWTMQRAQPDRSPRETGKLEADFRIKEPERVPKTGPGGVLVFGLV